MGRRECDVRVSLSVYLVVFAISVHLISVFYILTFEDLCICPCYISAISKLPKEQ